MAEYWPREEPHPKIENKGLPLLKRTNQERPPPQALRFSHSRGERETRVAGDKPQGTMGPCGHLLIYKDVTVHGSILQILHGQYITERTTYTVILLKCGSR